MKAMKILFLGTGAAEGVPAAYCRCDACEGVRERGGVEIKSRSSLRINSRYQIDIPPDNYLQMIRHGTDMYDIRHLLITHSHEDHISLSAISDRTMSKEIHEEPLRVYMSKPGYDYAMKIAGYVPLSDLHANRVKERIEIDVLEYYTTYQIGELTVETVVGAHDAFGENEHSINYLLTDPGGSSLLYALDTGYYTEGTWEYLEGRRTDTLILDCTFAGRTDRGELPYGHLDQQSYLKMLDRMSSIGFIDSDTKIFATHFNPHQGLTHFEIQERFDESPFDVTVAYDGLITETPVRG